MPFLSWVAGGGGGSGSVTSVSVVSAHGFSGTVANPTTTPAITLSETVSGLLKGSSGSLAAATSADVPGVAGVAVSGTPTSGQVLTATSGTAADWQTASGGGAVSSVSANDSSVVISPTTGAVLVNTGTLDAIATDHPPAGNWSNNSHKITSLANGSAAQDAVAFGQIPAGGAVMPWQFTPEQNSGIGDGKIEVDGAMSSSVNPTHLACATSTPFASGDVGKVIIVMGAGASGAPLITTIATFTDSGHVILSAAASTTVSGAGLIFGTDNTAAIKAAIAAAFAYAQANGQYAEIIFEPLIYCVGGAATVGGGTLGNAIFPLPLVDATAKPKVTLAFKGLQSDSAALLHWLQPTVQNNGAVLAILRNDGSSNITYGLPSVIGGPFAGYGGATSVFNNMQPVIDNLSILLPFNATFSGFDFFGSAEAVVKSASVLPMATVVGGSPWPQISVGGITNAPQFGLRMPDVNNNDRCDVQWFSAEGQCYGIMPSEHSTVDTVRCIQCIIGIQAYASSNTPHAAHIRYASVEACSQCVGALTTAGGAVKLDIQLLDLEGPFTNILFDTANLYTGWIGFRNAGTGYQASWTNQTDFTARLVNLDQTNGPVASPQAPPGNNSAWFNGYNRDLWITLSATTITGLKIDSTAQNGLAGSPATYEFLLPTGHSYTPTFTGTLTHTVTII